MRSFIYADDLCIAMHDASFENTESMFSDALDNIGEYYAGNHMRANMCIPYPKQRSQPKDGFLWCRKELEYTITPTYMGIILDRTLSNSTHMANVKSKTAARNNVLTKFKNSKWDANLATIRTTALTLSYSNVEYACPVWERSTHAHRVNPVLNYAVNDCVKQWIGLV